MDIPDDIQDILERLIGSEEDIFSWLTSYNLYFECAPIDIIESLEGQEALRSYLAYVSHRFKGSSK